MARTSRTSGAVTSRPAALLVLPVLVGLASLLGLLSGCGPSTAACGWDLSTPEGVQANQQRLSEVHAWLDGHPGAPVPEPTSTYWHGECPATDTPPPPVDEGDHG